MIDKWIIKNVEGVMVLFMQGTLADAKIMHRKLSGFAKEPAQTSIPPYNYRIELTQSDPEILEKIKTAAEEAAVSSRYVMPFEPATLESAAAQRKENETPPDTAFSLKRDAVFLIQDSDGSTGQITSIDLNEEGLKIAGRKSGALEPVKETTEKKENFGDLENSKGMHLEGTGHNLDLAKTQIMAGADIPRLPAAAAQPPAAPPPAAAAPPPAEPPAPAPETEKKSEDIKPQIDALLTRAFAARQPAKPEDDKPEPLGLEGILAAKTALDVYASDNDFKKDVKRNILSKEENDKIREILAKTQKTAFNIFEQEIKKKEAAAEHAVDPVDLLLTKKTPAAPAPRVIPGKKSFEKKPAPAAPKRSESAPPPGIQTPPPANINLEPPAPAGPPQATRVINPEPEAEETKGMPRLKLAGFPPRPPQEEPEIFAGPPVVGGAEFEDKTQKTHSFLTKKIESAHNAPVKEESKAGHFINPFDSLENLEKHDQSFIREIEKKDAKKQ